jgi:hypothetical protein
MGDWRAWAQWAKPSAVSPADRRSEARKLPPGEGTRSVWATEKAIALGELH